MLERTNCQIWGYDFSVDAFGPAIQNTYASRTHFLKAGISGTTESSKDPPFYTIQDLMAKNGHTYMYVFLLSPPLPLLIPVFPSSGPRLTKVFTPQQRYPQNRHRIRGIRRPNRL